MDETTRERLLDQFLGGIPPGRQSDLLRDMMETVLRYAQDNAPVNELKLVSRSMREMRYAGEVFRKYADRRKVAVFGSARTRADEPDFQLAREFARRITAEGYMIITGGGDGIMGAAQRVRRTVSASISASPSSSIRIRSSRRIPSSSTSTTSSPVS